MYDARMWTALKITITLVVCYVAIVIWVYASQRKMLFHPSHFDAGSPTDVGLAYEDVRMKTSLGTRIQGWWLPHEKPRFTLLFSHGNAGNITHRIQSLRIFHDLGLSVMVYDYSGYGQSDGEPSEEATQADAQAAWDWLVNEQHIPADQIVLFGRSLGGAVTARLAADLASNGVTPAGIIMESTFSSVPDMGAYMYPWLPVRQLAKYKYDSVAALTSVTAPALFAHSGDDEIVPFALGDRLYLSYGSHKQFMEMRGDHNSGYMEMGPEYPAGLDQFLKALKE